MILGIQLPDGARTETTEDNKVLIIFDEKSSARDLWKNRFDMWLTQGKEKEDFYKNPCLSNKGITITHRNFIKV